MVIANMIVKDNELMNAGKIDEQIIADFEKMIEERKVHQREHLDKKVKGVSHHYEEWTQENNQKIAYMERILECVKAVHGSRTDCTPCTPDIQKESAERSNCIRKIPNELLKDLCMEIHNCADCHNEETGKVECNPAARLERDIFSVDQNSFAMDFYADIKLQRKLSKVATKHGYEFQSTPEQCMIVFSKSNL